MHIPDQADGIAFGHHVVIRVGGDEILFIIDVDKLDGKAEYISAFHSVRFYAANIRNDICKTKLFENKFLDREQVFVAQLREGNVASVVELASHHCELSVEVFVPVNVVLQINKGSFAALVSKNHWRIKDEGYVRGEFLPDMFVDSVYQGQPNIVIHVFIILVYGHTVNIKNPW